MKPGGLGFFMVDFTTSIYKKRPLVQIFKSPLNIII